MPELPEVENFRRLLLPLVSREHPLVLERCSLEKIPPRKFITDREISDIVKSKFFVADVLRKGKLLCMVLKLENEMKERGGVKNDTTKFLFLHMGMTGRISTPDFIPKLKVLSKAESYPPSYTYLQMIAGSNQACFSDPRKFGAIYVKDFLEEDFDILAPDAWISTCQISKQNENLHDGGAQGSCSESTIADIVAKLSQQSMGIKGVLLDQKRALCGIGNWVADEVLYQTKMHPDQNYLTHEEAKNLLRSLNFILKKAIRCLDKKEDYPRDWLFHYRWKKRSGSKSIVKDFHGRSIAFVVSGGRTSAVVTSIQKKKSRKLVAATARKEQIKQGNTNKRIASSKVATRPEVAVSERNKKLKVTTKAQKKKIEDSKNKLKNPKEDTGVFAGIKRQTRRSPRLVKT